MSHFQLPAQPYTIPPNHKPSAQVNGNKSNNENSIIKYTSEENKSSGHGLGKGCSHNHDDDTDEEPWPESFDPAKPEKPFTPIFTQPPRHPILDIKLEEESNLISHKRPQRNQKQFVLNNLNYPNIAAPSSRSFKASYKGPIEFFPSLKRKNYMMRT